MRPVAYLVNRYPEASLVAIRREICGVEGAGVTVLRFAHRPSNQPFAGAADRVEAERTEYLATAPLASLLLSFLRIAASRPGRIWIAMRRALRLRPAKIAHLGHLLLACRLLERLRRAGARQLHVHFGLESAVVAMLTRDLGGPPWSMTVHGPEEFEPEKRSKLRILVQAAGETIAISEWAANAIRRIAGPEDPAIRVIGMGVDNEFLTPPVAVRDSGSILCIARLETRKGHEVLLDALSSIPAQRRNFLCELIGDGSCRAQLEAEVSRRRLAANIRFTGWLTEDEVRRKLDLCRFLVLPSLAEGLPVVIMEAFARARPVIATGVAGVAELVRHDENGMLVAAGDSGALARAIEFMHGLPAERLFELGLRGRTIVLDKCDSRRNALELAATWQRRRVSGS
jgi:colanic acid/amylovoran biosynthesis glycosyltransferase